MALAATIAAAAAHAPPASAVDASVANIQATQGIQTFGDDVPLIAHRRTAVRAVVAVDPPNTFISAFQPITGRMRMFVIADGQEREITPAAGLAAEAPLTSTNHALGMTAENGTLNFELPFLTRLALEPPAGDTSATLRTEVTISFGADDDTSNNTDTQELTLRRQAVPTILYTRITYEAKHQQGVTLLDPPRTPAPAKSAVRPGLADLHTSAALPLDNSCPRCLYRWGSPRFTFRGDWDGDREIDHGSVDQTTLLQQLIERRAALEVNGRGPSENTFLYGWIADSVLDGHGGVADDVGGVVGYGTDRPDIKQMVLAHEVGHLLGRVPNDEQHNDPPLAFDPDIGWDVGGQLVGNPVENLATGRLKTGGSDLMDPAPTFPFWVKPATARAIIDHDRIAANATTPQRPCLDEADTLSLTGRFQGPSLPPNAEALLLARSTLADFRPVIFDRCSGQLIRTRGTTAAAGAGPAGTGGEPVLVEARVRDGRRTLTLRERLDPRRRIERDIRPGAARSPERMGVGAFGLELPLPEDARVDSLVVRAVSGGRVYARLSRSASPPAVRVLSPGSKSRLAGFITLRWRATDADTARSRLRAQVSYSPDDGRHFVPVEVDVRGTALRLDTTALPRTAAGRGILRLHVSDGLNTTVARVTGLSLARFDEVLESPRPVD